MSLRQRDRDAALEGNPTLRLDRRRSKTVTPVSSPAGSVASWRVRQFVFRQLFPFRGDAGSRLEIYHINLN